MKFSIVSSILLAQGITAMPWSNGKAKTGEEITLHIQISQGSSASQDVTTISKPNGRELCLGVCWGGKPDCPEGWTPKQVDGQGGIPCWTCCKPGPDGGYL